VDQFAPSGMINSFPESIVTKYPFFFYMHFLFHVNELEEQISFVKEGSSPGNDLINYSILKSLLVNAIQKLLITFNRILNEASSYVE